MQDQPLGDGVQQANNAGRGSVVLENKPSLARDPKNEGSLNLTQPNAESQVLSRQESKRPDTLKPTMTIQENLSKRLSTLGGSPSNMGQSKVLSKKTTSNNADLDKRTLVTITDSNGNRSSKKLDKAATDFPSIFVNAVKSNPSFLEKTARNDSMTYFKANFKPLSIACVKGIKSAMQKIAIGLWLKNLGVNIVRDDSYLENYGVRFEDDKAELALGVIYKKLTEILINISEAIDPAYFDADTCERMSNIFNKDKTLPKNFFYRIELDRLSFRKYGALDKY